MKMHCTRLFLIAVVIADVMFAGLAKAQTVSSFDRPPTDKERAAAIEEVKKVDQEYADKAGEERYKLISDSVLDIHGSGWLYTKAESLEMCGNGLPRPGGCSGGSKATKELANPNVTKPVASFRSQHHIVALSKDVVLVTEENISYYEVRDPQDVARAAGTMTDDPAALAKAAANPPASPGPGMAIAPNPYRARTTRVWIRDDGRWLLAIASDTRVGEKVVPGRN